MPTKSDKVVAILCADLHLSHRPPLARSKEPDWYDAMRKPLKELRNLWHELRHPPILCAGDVFDKWNPPPELINFALEELPQMYAIPGQHDLPYHSLDQIEKSGFWTLVKAETIHYIPPGRHFVQVQVPATPHLHVFGFPWGVKIEAEPRKRDKGYLRVALVHEYTWIPGAGYEGSPEEARADVKSDRYNGYDLVVIGDNHQAFDSTTGDGKGVIFNCGSFMRRTSDQLLHIPRVGLLKKDGSVETYILGIEDECFNTTWIGNRPVDAKLEAFVDSLRDLQTKTLDYAEALNRAASERDVPPAVRQFLVEALNAESR